jgi:hypothetical protein
VAKRTRSERRKAREQRAVSGGDAPALHALAERNASAGAKALVRYLQGLQQQDPSPEMLQLVARTAARLRAEASFDLALSLCAAAGRRTPELRLEEAVAAFARGDDARVGELAAQDPSVARMAAPWLAAIEGRRVPSALPGSTAAYRALLVACRAVSSLVQGRGARVRSSISAVQEPARSRLFLTELVHVSTLMAGRTSDSFARAAVALARSHAVRSSCSACASLAMTVAQLAPRLFLERLGDQMGLGEEATRDAAVLASCAIAGVHGQQAQVSQMIARVGADAFFPAERANACLHEGFAVCSADPSRARAAFDRAVALGADLAEALRGRLLVERARIAKSRDNSPKLQEATRSLISNATLLVQQLQRDPAGGPLAVAALLDGVEGTLSLGQSDRARELLSRARQLAEAGGFLTEALRTKIEMLEAESCFRGAPQRASELADAVLARDANHHQAWHLKIDLKRRKDPVAADDLVLRAAELKICPELTAHARQIREARGIAPNLVPGQTTTGELASELLRRVAKHAVQPGRGSELDDDIHACRSALDVDKRCAFDMASVCILACRGQLQQAAQRLADLLADPGVTKDIERKLVSAAVVTFEPSMLDSIVGGFANNGRTQTAIEVLRMLVRDGEVETAERLTAKLAPKLTATELRGLQALVRSANLDTPVRGLPDAWRILVGADGLLSPDFSLQALLTDDEIGDGDSALSDLFDSTSGRPAVRHGDDEYY